MNNITEHNENILRLNHLPPLQRIKHLVSFTSPQILTVEKLKAIGINHISEDSKNQMDMYNCFQKNKESYLRLSALIDNPIKRKRMSLSNIQRLQASLHYDLTISADNRTKSAHYSDNEFSESDAE